MSATPSGTAPRTVTLALVAAAVLALSISGQTYLGMYDHGHAWWRILIWQALTWSYWAALTPALFRLCERFGDAPLAWRRIGLLAAIGGRADRGAPDRCPPRWSVALQPYVPIAELHGGVGTRAGDQDARHRRRPRLPDAGGGRPDAGVRAARPPPRASARRSSKPTSPAPGSRRCVSRSSRTSSSTRSTRSPPSSASARTIRR